MGKETKNPLTVIGNATIKKSGIMDFTGVQKAISEWFSRYAYEAINKSHTEKKTPTGTYMESSWKAKRKVTYYVYYEITVDIWLRDMTDVAVEEHGGKIKRQKGRLEIVINSKMQKDWLKKFSDTKGEFKYFLKLIFERFIIRKTLEKLEDQLFYETNDLMAEIRSKLE